MRSLLQIHSSNILAAAKHQGDTPSAPRYEAALDTPQIDAVVHNFRSQGRYVLLCRTGVSITSIETFTVLDDAYNAMFRHQRSDPYNASCSLYQPIYNAHHGA